jgi:tRNA-dihydrouridine synthase
MIGRAAIGYPWIFDEIKYYLKTGEHLPPPTIEQRVRAIKKHLQRSLEWKGATLGMLEMRRHYANYLKGLPNIKEYRMRLVTLKEPEPIYELLEEINETYGGLQAERRHLNISEMAYSCG